MPFIKRPALLAAMLPAVILLAGCMTVGPDYVPPAPMAPLGWHTAPDPALVPDKTLIRNWWTVFDDPLLTRLIEEASVSNLELKTAVARIKEAGARLRAAGGERFPVADAVGQVSREHTSENGLAGIGLTTTRHIVAMDSNWEIDLFGRISRSIEAATADYQVSEEDRTDVMVSLYAAVARSYLTLRTLQARLSETEGNIASQKQVLDLTRTRFKFGLATDLDVAQAENILAGSEAQVPPFREQLVQTMNSIAVLLGKAPGTLSDELGAVKPIPIPPRQVAVGVPADLLRQRPDIRRAERRLAAQTARIGVATADLYPRFSLLGTFGLEATDIADLANGGSGFHAFGPSLRWNIFDGSRIRSQIKVQDALTEQALLQYEQTVLNALGEVENAMTAFVEGRNRMEALERSVAASQRTLELAIGLYKDGLRDFQNVLDAQRTVFDNENQLAVAKGIIAVNLVELYRALGGGWSAEPNEKEPI